LILNSPYYPIEWSKDRIISIHKGVGGGNTSNPENYRDITIPSCLGKLFNFVLITGLCRFFDKQNITSPAQCDFSKKHRTTDLMVILQNMINPKIIKPKGKLSLELLLTLHKLLLELDKETHHINY